MVRIRAIDTFRGLSIVLMVFFTLILKLSDELPDVLVHDAVDSLHAGDFVLPMFLFASGMSLVFFAKKREKKKRLDYALDIAERFGKLLLISLFLTPLSAGEFLGMDVVMLSAVLFIPTIILIGLPEIALAALAVTILASYLLLQQMVLLPDFSLHHLGGYAAALFYLPVMLAGAIAGKRLDEIKKLLLVSLMVSIVFLLAIPPYKMSASPSFMALSVSFSLLVFLLVKDLKSERLEYLGRKPIRYWVLMWVVLLVPLAFYVIAIGSDFPLWFGWMESAAAALVTLPLLYLISKGMDFIYLKVKHMMVSL